MGAEADSNPEEERFQNKLLPIFLGGLLTVCAALAALRLGRNLAVPPYFAPAVLIIALVVKLINRGRILVLHYAMGSLYYITVILWLAGKSNRFFVMAACFLLFFAAEASAEEYTRRRTTKTIGTAR